MHAQELGRWRPRSSSPTSPPAGPAALRSRANRSLRVRMIGAVLVAGVATVAVGAFGDRPDVRRSARPPTSSTHEGTVPVDALRNAAGRLVGAADPHRAREHRGAAAGDPRVGAGEGRPSPRADPRRGRRGGRRPAAARPTPTAAFGEFAGATAASTSRWSPSSSRSSPTPRRRVRQQRPSLAAGPPLEPGGPAGRRRTRRRPGRPRSWPRCSRSSSR